MNSFAKRFDYIFFFNCEIQDQRVLFNYTRVDFIVNFSLKNFRLFLLSLVQCDFKGYTSHCKVSLVLFISSSLYPLPCQWIWKSETFWFAYNFISSRNFSPWFFYIAMLSWYKPILLCSVFLLLSCNCFLLKNN